MQSKSNPPGPLPLWKIGDRVKHPIMPEWGQGEVKAVISGGKIQVRFVHAGEKMFDFSKIQLIRATEAEAKQPLFVNPAPSRKSASSRRSFQEYRQVFLDLYPKGFRDPGYIEDERVYKLEAKEMLEASLSKPRFHSLIRAKEFDEIAELAMKIVYATNLSFPNEKMALRDGLRTAKGKEEFCRSLFDLLHGTEDFQVRFTKFSDVLSRINAGKWTLATYFPYLAVPDNQMFMKPICTQRIADACQVALNYRPEPNWLTYECLLRLAAHLKEALADLKPKDMIDIQSFIWKVAK